ncbi:MAG: ribonuclease III [Gammaproteobacteria bacterium]
MPIGLAKKIGYKFKDETLLNTALTHRSSGKNNNERLEYLGDAILGLIIAETLYHRFPAQPEGVLTRLRAAMVRRETLANLARSLEIGDHLKLGTGEKRAGGWRRDSILSNAMEAVIGALYLDSDFDRCRRFVLDLYADLLSDLSLENIGKDPKTALQEYLQARKLQLPSYQVIAEEGEAHLREFTVECSIDGLDKKIIAQGKSKRTAEQSAARKALDLLQPENG